jgi:hypothetical protein
VLAFTAAKMIVSEPLLSDLYYATAEPASEVVHQAAQWITYALAVFGVVAGGWWSGRQATSAGGEKLVGK